MCWCSAACRLARLVSVDNMLRGTWKALPMSSLVAFRSASAARSPIDWLRSCTLRPVSATTTLPAPPRRNFWFHWAFQAVALLLADGFVRANDGVGDGP